VFGVDPRLICLYWNFGLLATSWNFGLICHSYDGAAWWLLMLFSLLSSLYSYDGIGI
jgi:hypothetical protein